MGKENKKLMSACRNYNPIRCIFKEDICEHAFIHEEKDNCNRMTHDGLCPICEEHHNEFEKEEFEI